jgi:hypothetical protein
MYMPRAGKMPLKTVFRRLRPISLPTNKPHITEGFKIPYCPMMR